MSTRELKYVDGRLVDNQGTIVDRLDPSSGYRRVWNGKRLEMSHRYIYRMHYGDFKGNIDHKDRDPLNNRIENLRVCTQSTNTINSSIRSDNTSGYKGVTWHKSCQKWASQTMKGGKRVHLGVFECPKEAALAYNYRVKDLFGEFCVFNKVF